MTTITDFMQYSSEILKIIGFKEDIAETIVLGIIAISVLSVAIISKLTEWGTSLLSGAITSNVAGSIVQSTTGNTLKTIIFRVVLIVPISISAFSAATIVVSRLLKLSE